MACAAVPAATDALCVLALDKALPGDKPLLVHLDVRRGHVALAAATAPLYNRVPGAVEAGDLRVTADTLEGALAISLPSDGYFPPVGKVVAFTVTLKATIADGKMTGAYAGTRDGAPVQGVLAGEVSARPDDRAVMHVAGYAEDVVERAAKPGMPRRLRMFFGLRDGVAYDVQVEPEGTLTDTGYGARVTHAAIACHAGRLLGSVEVSVTPMVFTGTRTTYVYTVDGMVIGDLACATIGVVCNGKALDGAGMLLANVTRTTPDLRNGLPKLTLHDALGPGKYLDLYLTTTDGRLDGFAVSPSFNNAVHDLDLTKLVLDGNRLTGEVGVTVRPDLWTPKDGQPIACRFALDARLDGAEIAGTYTGTSGAKAVGGDIQGFLQAKPALPPLTRLMLKAESGLTGGTFESRAFIAIDVLNGTVKGGSVSNNHDKKLNGTVDGGELRVVDDRLVGTVRITVTASGKAEKGVYAFTVNIPLTGTVAAGSCTVEHNGTVKRSPCYATLRPTT